MANDRLTVRQFSRRVLASVLVCLHLGSAWAGAYQLVTGRGKDVCEAYKQNFEPRRDPEPMACERRYDPNIQGFSTPNWIELDLHKHFDLFRKARIYIMKNDNSPEGMKLSDKEIEAATDNLAPSAAHWHVKLYLAKLDLAADGHMLDVLKVQQVGCGPLPKPDDKITTSNLFFVNDALTDIDERRQDNMNGWFEHATIEIYKGKPYIEVYVPDDDWRSLLTGSGTLQVLQYARVAEITREFPQAKVRGDGPLAVCEVKYVHASNGIK